MHLYYSYKGVHLNAPSSHYSRILLSVPIHELLLMLLMFLLHLFLLVYHCLKEIAKKEEVQRGREKSQQRVCDNKIQVLTLSTEP